MAVAPFHAAVHMAEEGSQVVLRTVVARFHAADPMEEEASPSTWDASAATKKCPITKERRNAPEFCSGDKHASRNRWL